MEKVCVSRVPSMHLPKGRMLREYHLLGHGGEGWGGGGILLVCQTSKYIDSFSVHKDFLII